MSNTHQQIIDDLASLMGASAVIAEPGQMATYLDEPRRRFHTPALAVVRPADVAATQKLVAWANARGVPLVPQGGNTGLVGGQVPLSGREIIVSLGRLDRVRAVNAAAGHVVIEAGVVLSKAQAVADAAGALLPLSLASEGSATIGGLLATNAGGAQVLAYGTTRDLCLGVEAVLADGRLYNGLSALKKDNTGYDLKNLLIGSEGTLAFLTAAVIKLFPKPSSYETAFCSLADPSAALELFYRLRDRAGPRLSAFELIPDFGIALQLQHGQLSRSPAAGTAPWYALVEMGDFSPTGDRALEDGLGDAAEAGLLLDATLARSEADRRAMWTAREQMSEVQSREGTSIKHDISVPVAAIPRMIEEGTAAIARLVPGVRPCPFGHMGDGNLHFNFSQPKDAVGAAFMAREPEINAALYEIVLALGGSVSAEHGIGQLKRALLAEVKDPVVLDMMRVIKRAMDPNNILNPGKVLE